jgi:glycosyltransferase involved in cell wall biosynthesis
MMNHKENVEPVKVFYFVDSFNVGGSETQLVQSARRLDPSKFQLTVGCLKARGPLRAQVQQAGIQIVEFDPKGGFAKPSGILAAMRLASFLKRERFDVIHTFDLYSNLMGIPAAWLARVPLRISSRRELANLPWYTPRRRKILRRILLLSHLTVVNSGAIRDLMINDDAYPPRRIRVIRNGIDLNQFSSIHANRSDVLPCFGADDQVVAMVANMNFVEKGHADLIEAAKSVCARARRAKFVLVGDGGERPALEQSVQAAGLEGRVLFLGRRADVPEILKCSDLSVLPSWSEGLPNVVMESVAVGTPVVATRVGGIPEIIEDGVSGLLVPPRDPAALAAALIRLLEDPELAARMATRAHEALRQHFSFDRVIAELESLYAQARTVEPNPSSEATTPETHGL